MFLAMRDEKERTFWLSALGFEHTCREIVARQRFMKLSPLHYDISRSIGRLLRKVVFSEINISEHTFLGFTFFQNLA